MWEKRNFLGIFNAHATVTYEMGQGCKLERSLIPISLFSDADSWGTIGSIQARDPRLEVSRARERPANCKTDRGGDKTSIQLYSYLRLKYISVFCRYKNFKRNWKVWRNLRVVLLIIKILLWLLRRGIQCLYPQM